MSRIVSAEADDTTSWHRPLDRRERWGDTASVNKNATLAHVAGTLYPSEARADLLERHPSRRHPSRLQNRVLCKLCRCRQGAVALQSPLEIPVTADEHGTRHAEDQAGHVCILLLHTGGDTLHPGGNTLHPGADTLRSLMGRNVRRRFNCRESKSLQDFVDLSLTQTMPGNRKRTTQHIPILSEQIQGKHKRYAAAEHGVQLSLIHISEPTRLRRISYAVFCLKKKK